MSESISNGAKIANRLHDLGFIRLRNGTVTPYDEDRQLIEQTVAIVLGEISDREDDGSGLLLNFLGMK